MNDTSRSSAPGQNVENAWVGGDLTLIQRVQGNVSIHHHHPPMTVEWPVRVGAVPKEATAFQPRDDLRGRIESARHSGTAVVLTQVLAGGGGVGKSQLAAHYARHAIRDGTDLIVWINAATTESVVAAYAETAARIQVPGVGGLDAEADARALLDWLSTTTRSWLVVLDDIQDPFAVVPWWPDSHAGTGWVLGTTRRRDAVISGAGRKVVEVDTYSPLESANYFAERLGGSNAYLLDNKAADLAAALGHLPLALAHAAAFMLDQQISSGRYLELFTARRSKLDELMPVEADTEGYGRQVAITLRLALDAAQGRHPKGLAIPVIRLISVLDPAGHPETFWRLSRTARYLRRRRGNGVRRMLRLHTGIGRSVSYEEARAAILLLRRFGLVTFDGQSNYCNIRLHELTARAVRETMPDSEVSKLTRLAASVVLTSWPRADHSNWELAAILRANAAKIAANSTRSLRDRRIRKVCYRAGNSLLDAGMYNAAAEYWKVTSDTASTFLGIKHRHSLSARANFAASMERSGRVTDAIALKEQVAADSVRILGARHPDSLTALATLASSYGESGRFDEAISLLERVITEFKYVDGAPFQNIEWIHSDLAVLYAMSGKHLKAIPILEDLLAQRIRTSGVNHPATLATRSSLAAAYFDAGRAKDAAVLLEGLTEGLAATLGAEHPVTLKAHANRAAFQSLQPDQFSEALEELESVVADTIRVLGSDHRDMLQIRKLQAARFVELGRLGEAIGTLESVVENSARILGDLHLETLHARISLASTYSHAGRFTSAIDLGERATSDATRLLGGKHPATLKAQVGLASAYREAGDVEAGIKIGEQVFADSVQVLGIHHADTLHAQAQLAACYKNAGRLDAAIATAESAAESMGRYLGADHPQTLEMRGSLATCYCQVGRYDEAISLQEHAVVALTRVRGVDHPDTVGARMNLGAIYSEAGRIAEATDAEEASTVDCARILGAEHPITLLAHANLAVTYWRAGHQAKAINLLDRIAADYARVLGRDHPDAVAAVKTGERWRQAACGVDS